MSNIYPCFSQMIDLIYQMSHSAKIVSAIFYEHALAAILAVNVIHAMKREQSPVNCNNTGTLTADKHAHTSELNLFTWNDNIQSQSRDIQRRNWPL
jgi:hypothetical protein